MSNPIVTFFSSLRVPVVVSPTNPLPVTVSSGSLNPTPMGYQQIIGMVAATALTVPPGATSALITTESQSVRFRDDGANPTAAIGQILLTGQDLFYNASLSAIRFIQTTATATLNVTYYA